MIRNYLKLAYRQMTKNLSFSVINLLGLTIGLTVSMLIFLWIKDELSYDRFHDGEDRIYRVSWHAKYGANEWNIPLIPVPVGPTLEEQYPEVEYATQVFKGGMTFQNGSNYIREKNGAFVDENFFRIFTVQFIQGDPNTALDEPNSIIINREMAERYFPNANALGSTLINNQDESFNITGIVESWPDQSHLDFDYLMPIHSVQHVTNRQTAWGAATVLTYFRIAENKDIAALSSRFDAYVQSEILGDNFDHENNFNHFPFHRLTDIHLRSNLQMDSSSNGDITYIYLFGLIAILILGLACINFTNLSTAKALVRAREVGVRKVLGSSRQQLIRQFFMEAFVFVFLGALFSVICIILILPYFNSLTNKELSIGFDKPSFWYGSLCFIFFVSIIAGVIPALTISKFKPIQVLKGKFTGSLEGAGLRKVLVIGQFVISISLIAGTMIIKNQLDFMHNQKLGFDKEQVIVINQASALRDQSTLFRERLAELPWATEASSSQFVPGDEFDSMGFIPQQPANFERTSINYNFINDRFVEVLNLKLQAGRNFDADRPVDSLAFIINESAAKTLGWEDPVGKKISYNGEDYGPVVGVVSDFHYASLHQPVEPLIMVHTQRPMSKITIKMSTSDVPGSIASLARLWKDHAPKSPLNYSFLDENYNALYQAEHKMSNLFLWAAILAILIACLGLYGLALFNAQRRVKEIGIRKILGASVNGLFGLMAKEYLQLILISMIIAAPLTWLIAKKWLMNFAFHTTISWTIFIMACLITLIVAGLTVSFHSFKVVFTKPVDNLREE